MTDGAIHSLSAEQRVRCETQHNAEGKGEHPAGKVGAHNFDIWIATATDEKDDRQGKREGSDKAKAGAHRWAPGKVVLRCSISPVA
jgi:hypothetical protein